MIIDTLVHAIVSGDMHMLRHCFGVEEVVDVNAGVMSHMHFDTPLMIAVDHNNVDAVNLLLSKGARASRRDDIGRTALTICLDRQDVNIEILKFLLDTENPVIDKIDIMGRTPLIIAVGRSIDAVKLLVEKGAAVTTKDSVGKTALMEAAAKGKLEIVKFLVESGSVIDARDASNNTALLYATSLNIFGLENKEIVKYLIEKGANVNAKNNQSHTAAMWAAKRGYVDILDILLSHQCDTSVVDSRGWSALKYAQEWDQIEIIEMLEALDKQLPEICVLVYVNGTPFELHDKDSCTTNVAIGQRKVVLFGIANYGTTDLNIKSVDVSNAVGFTLNTTMMAYIVKAHSRTSFEVYFNPIEIRQYDTELKICSNDPNEQLTIITINGNGLQ